MGVHGLTTYLRERKRLLARTTLLASGSNESIPVVIDGWSFIYDLYITSNLPWVYGGEYDKFAKEIKTVVESWIRIGLQVYFVFDGACPDLKFPTVISRLSQSHIQPAQLFFRTSPSSRSTGRFLNENRILPPLAYSTCIHTLQSLRSQNKPVELHFADEEGDPYAVELAGRLGGYVVGNDSDFVIFNSDGYKGYIPIDEMVWQAPLPAADQVSIDDGDGEFQTVKKPKAKKKTVSNSSAPQEGVQELSLSFISYSPSTLADHLDLPVSLLPLLGALVGNDFSKESESNSRRIQSLFFERQLTLPQRIEKVAKTMHSVVSPQKRKAKQLVGSVMDLIERTVNALLARLPSTLAMGSGEVESIIDKIVNATLQYAIPKYGGDIEGHEGLWASPVCALHDPEACTILPMISRNVMRQAEVSDQADPDLLRAREQYLDAYRRGLFSPKTMDILNTGSSWAKLFLENPDLETVGRSIGRPIREWIHSILDDTVGLGVSEDDPRDDATSIVESEAKEGDVEEEEDDDSDGDELVDVVESDSDDSQVDYLAPLKGELHRLHGSDDESEDQPTSSITPIRRLASKTPYVTEYLRRGTRIASEAVVVAPVSLQLSSISMPEYGEDEAPPLVLGSEDDRFTIFLRALKSDIPSVRVLSPSTILPVLAVRWVVISLHSRWQENTTREREKERWSREEARCFLSSFAWDDSATDKTQPAIVLLEDRNVQLMAQVLMALDTIEQFSQTLLLTDRIKSEFYRLSGKTFHGYLTGAILRDKELPEGLWDAMEEGLSDAFQEERVKKAKKTKADKVAALPSVAKTKTNGNKSFYALLGDSVA